MDMYKRQYLAILLGIIIAGLLAGIVSCSGEKKHIEQEHTEYNHVTTIEDDTLTESQDSLQKTVNDSSDKDTAAVEDADESEEEASEDVIAEELTQLSDYELWEKYREAKADLETHRNENNFPAQIEDLKIAARCANLLGKPDIEAWQFNNMGYFTILEFKRLAAYHVRINKIETMKAGRDKIDYTEETKQKFAEYFYLLESAEKYLNKAKRIDKDLNDMNRTKMILNNKKFVDSIKRFIE